jgi:hypothetical protein
MKKIILILMLLIVRCSIDVENCNAQSWSPLGSGIIGSNAPGTVKVSTLIIYNNELIAGGYFYNAGGGSARNIAKWNGANWSSLGSGTSNINSSIYSVNALTIFNNELIVGGSFDTAGGLSVSNIAKWNGTTWSPFGGSGMNQAVSALTIYNSELIAGGSFTSAGGVNVSNIAKWNGTTWSPLGSGMNMPVSALVVYNSELIAGGLFTTAGGTTVNCIAKWNGTNWAPLGSGVSASPPFVSVLAVYNNELIAGGFFSSAGGVSAYCIAKWNGTNWSSLGSGCDDIVFSLAVYNNELIAGGYFNNAGGVQVNRIAKWNGGTWSSLGSGIIGGTPPVEIRFLTVFNNNLVAGGNFDTAGGIAANNIAKWGQAFTVSGLVRYSDNSQPATGGYVKAIKFDRNTGNIITFDSAQIQANGSYTLSNVPQDSLDIGVYPNSTTNNDWVVTYYPSTIYWQGATTIYPTGNMTNVNIGAIRKYSVTANNSVNGKVMRLTDNLIVGNLKDAVLYAKSGNSFVQCAISDVNGVYHLPSLPVGSLKIICNRMGFTNDSAMVTVTSTSNIDSINFHLYRLPVGIKQISSNVPSEYKLYQNYPNPFNPTTNIRYQITNNRFVLLKVYDILGKEIATLVNEKQSPGVYEVIFDGSNLSSGIYFYTLTAGDFRATKRFVLIK